MRASFGMLLILSCFLTIFTCQTANTTPLPQSASTDQSPAQTSTQSGAQSAARLPTPSITGPLQAASPINLDAGPFGKLDLNGTVTGFGLVQGNHVNGNDTAHAALSNGQIFLQRTEGWLQFYVQAGAYNILSLGTPFLPTDKAISNLYSPVPVAYLKFVPGKIHFDPDWSTPDAYGCRIDVRFPEYEY